MAALRNQSSKSRHSWIKRRTMDTIASGGTVRHNPNVTTQRTTRPSRIEPRDIVELRNLKNEQPDLAAAADWQFELPGARRRIQSRVPLPAVTFDRRKPDRQLRQPMLQFRDIP